MAGATSHSSSLLRIGRKSRSLGIINFYMAKHQLYKSRWRDKCCLSSTFLPWFDFAKAGEKRSQNVARAPLPARRSRPLTHNHNIIDHPPDLELMGDVHVSSRWQHFPRSNPKSNSKEASASPVAATWRITSNSPPPPPPTQHSAHTGNIKPNARRSQLISLHAQIDIQLVASSVGKDLQSQANSSSAVVKHIKTHCQRCQFWFLGGWGQSWEPTIDRSIECLLWDRFFPSFASHYVELQWQPRPAQEDRGW